MWPCSRRSDSASSRTRNRRSARGTRYRVELPGIHPADQPLVQGPPNAHKRIRPISPLRETRRIVGGNLFSAPRVRGVRVPFSSALNG
jgi:hypothetical protein